jgi:hypothetical protein
MTSAPDSRPPTPELEVSIRRAIARRTRTGAQALAIELVGNRIVVSGPVPSYHLKQLVLQGVIDVIGGEGAARIDLQLQVIREVPDSGAGTNEP